MHHPITPEKRMGMAIMKLDTATSLHFIRNQFSMAPCTARVVVHEVPFFVLAVPWALLQNAQYQCWGRRKYWVLLYLSSDFCSTRIWS
ncbi:hypothetical protein Y1Q_0020041 [Alligator mississippiensis]|uniref:Uncharacterized protein n=1 Tax=Alligator mississippiensis TaxID=8496 RepID=A0A151LYW2_ALLMI|nr:hypothetical protein Y1Q_0020041 [Alligator mississippiensis]